ncbi:cupin domain-containing protein [Salinimonas lutimaris]|uniref:cupin domain-containing protein n=1 Tax=Salinimonas lutimaris TaxID=914153 RepID=UPI0010BFCE1F|nr:cupin domain-containing protein [Salinimonas lutimaris]
MFSYKSKPHPLISRLGLEPHPEGGFFKQTFCSSHTVISPHHQQPRPAMTHIYFLLLKDQVSRFHRVWHDEVWNVYEGAPLRLYQLNQQQLKEQRIGPGETEYASVVPAGYYQAAESTGDYTLAGCTVAPGFDFADFSFIDEPCLAQWIEVAHPHMARFL